MKKKKIVPMIILLAVVAVLLICYFLLKNYNREQEKKEEAAAENDVVISFAEDDIKNLSFLISDKRVSFTRNEDGWVYDDDAQFPVDDDQMKVLTDALAEVTANRTLTDVEDLSSYGLDEPEDVIQVTDQEDKVTEITVGDTNESTGDCYISLNEDSRTVYTVTGDLSTVFSGSLMNYAKGDDYPTITGGSIERITLTGGENPFTLEKSEDSTSGWILTDGSGKQIDVGSSYVSTLQSAAAGLDYANYYEYNCTDFSKYGLDQPYAVLTVDYTETAADEEADENGETDTEEVSRQMVLRIGNENEEGNRYVSIEGSTQVHGISVDSLNELLQPSDENMEDLSVSNVPVSAIDKLTVVYKNTTHYYEIKEETAKGSDESAEESSETVYYRDGEKIDSLSFSSFYNKAIGMTAQKTTQDNPSGTAEMKLLFQKSDGSEINVEYYSYDTNFYLALRQDGKKYLVNKMNVREMFNAYEAIETESE